MLLPECAAIIKGAARARTGSADEHGITGGGPAADFVPSASIGPPDTVVYALVCELGIDEVSVRPTRSPHTPPTHIIHLLPPTSHTPH